ncbi:FKBP-type peptidyl-prolyl cis-trans isomerase [Antribacter gilvus]|uniref:FKBP-type peptidyl-prolyl cis-trans isomerase n=1 Tax=Antribacter gilvus TaxID=2304675 RepID=UPI001F0CA890|nr:FKBP-type peptidyl-prolyl cis-trans isomerase [Antribacter gilvus]
MKPVRVLVALVVAFAVLTGCAPGSIPTPLDDAAGPPPQAPVTVSGPAGLPPTLQYDVPFAVTEPGSRTIWPGTGDRVERGEPLLLNLYAQDGRDATALQNTFADAPVAYTMTETSLGHNLYEALDGVRVGARLLVIDEADGVPVLLVVDVLPTRAAGTEVQSPEGLPRVTRHQDGEPQISVPWETEPPQELVALPLVRGTGAQVEAGQIVTVEFTAVAWSTGEIFETTWEPGEPPQSSMVGIGQLVEGWDQGLLEKTVGSQVLLVVPPNLGFADTASPLAGETLVYVVDILDSHYPVAPEQEAQEG